MKDPRRRPSAKEVLRNRFIKAHMEVSFSSCVCMCACVCCSTQRPFVGFEQKDDNEATGLANQRCSARSRSHRASCVSGFVRVFIIPGCLAPLAQ